MIRVLLYQLLRQQPCARKPWLREYQDQGERLFEKDNCFDILWKVGLACPDQTCNCAHLISDIWKVLQTTLAEAELDVMYFVLYRPEHADSEIFSALPKLLRTTHTKCLIKWVIISRVQASQVQDVDAPRCIDLANRQSPLSPFTSVLGASTPGGIDLPPPAHGPTPTGESPVSV